MNATRTLLLSKWQLFWHYFLGLIPLVLGIMNLHWLIEVNSEYYNGIRTEKEIFFFTIFWFSLALLILIKKRRRLNFERIEVSLSETEFKNKMRTIAEMENWTLTNNTKKFAVFYNGSDWTWGLKMTILRFDNYILVNSLCDPDSKSCISIFNENTRNISKLKKYLEKPVANIG